MFLRNVHTIYAGASYLSLSFPQSVTQCLLVLKVSDDLGQIELRALIRYCWKRLLSTRAAAKEICDTEGEGTVHYTTGSRWYKRFGSGNLSVKDLRAALDDEPSSNSGELASIPGASSASTRVEFCHEWLEAYCDFGRKMGLLGQAQPAEAVGFESGFFRKEGDDLRLAELWGSASL
ncbi:unnamed protein product [Adineta ricciae]|uniref:Mos1 transposase HTH domain-containing protein n=1 Tax=Adineta ricciae TaxID=249248 RepID=A0A813P9D3_ADIRI|nr:unnamed protein product [Adineta ricciae]CAF1237890.1 unnamed protein product [Adineta ricciae]